MRIHECFKGLKHISKVDIKGSTSNKTWRAYKELLHMRNIVVMSIAIIMQLLLFVTSNDLVTSSKTYIER